MRFEAVEEDGTRHPLPLAHEVPRFLRLKRKAAGLSLQAVADEFAVVRQAVWSWEQGRSSPSLERLADLVKFFGGFDEPKKTERKQKKGSRSQNLARAEEILGV